MPSSKRNILFLAPILIAFLLTITNANGGTSGKDPEAYLLKSVGTVAVKTCKIEVSGKADCHPGTMGEAVWDSFRMGLTMMTISGLKGSEDKRWDYVVYAVTDKVCSSGGLSMGAMRTHPSIFKDTQKEIDGMVASKKISLEKSKIEGVDFNFGHIDAKKDCLIAFGYPSDSIVLLVMAGNDEREKIAKAVKAMLTGTTLILRGENKAAAVSVVSSAKPSTPAASITLKEKGACAYLTTEVIAEVIAEVFETAITAPTAFAEAGLDGCEVKGSGNRWVRVKVFSAKSADAAQLLYAAAFKKANALVGHSSPEEVTGMGDAAYYHNASMRIKRGKENIVVEALGYGELEKIVKGAAAKIVANMK